MTASNEVVFLFDVDNTLLDSDRVTADLRHHHDCYEHAREERSPRFLLGSVADAVIEDAPWTL